MDNEKRKIIYLTYLIREGTMISFRQKKKASVLFRISVWHRKGVSHDIHNLITAAVHFSRADIIRTQTLVSYNFP